MADEKPCTKCKEVKTLDMFSHGKNVCKKCRSKRQTELDNMRGKEFKEKKSEYNKQYWQKTKEKQTDRHKRWVEANKEKVKKYRVEYYANNINKIKEQNSKRHYENRIGNIKRSKEYYLNHKQELSLKRRIYEKNKTVTDKGYKALKSLRRRMLLAISNQSTKKYNNTMALVGCDKAKLIEHLQSKFKPGMTWDNHGIHGWHIDHIIPCAVFDLTDPEQQKKCFHYTNLQPLWARENLSKCKKVS